MKDGKVPNPDTVHPIAGYDKEIYVKPTIKNPNIIVGDFTYIAAIMWMTESFEYGDVTAPKHCI